VSAPDRPTNEASPDLYGEEALAAKVREVSPREPFLVRGDWVRRVEKRHEYALLEASSGSVMLDRGAIERACLALGLELKR
jgi:hypothetical protein